MGRDFARQVGVTVLARVPEAGRVKTRLARTIGDESAADLHAALARDTLERLHAWLARAGGALVLSLTGDPRRARELEEPARALGASVEWQGSGDLGERMCEAVARRLTEGSDAAIVTGTDAPLLADDLLDSCVAILAERDVALAPARDGGFVLLAARRAWPAPLRRVSWGTGRALAETCHALEEVGLSWGLGLSDDDVDDADGLRRLRTRLAGSPHGRWTRRWMETSGARFA